MVKRPRQTEDDRPDYWCAAGKSYDEIWKWLLTRHQSNLTGGFTVFDLERIHQKWKRLGAES